MNENPVNTTPSVPTPASTTRTSRDSTASLRSRSDSSIGPSPLKSPAVPPAGPVLSGQLGVISVIPAGDLSPQPERWRAELYRRGCPAGQGFLFARPMDPADAEAYLRRVTRPGVSA